MSPARYIFRLTAIIALLSMGGFNAATLATLHYHFLADGYVVAHSHPLPDGDKRNSHTHSKQEYAELDAACLLLDTMVVGATFDLPAILLSCDKVTLQSVSIPMSTAPRQDSARGPPSLSFS